MALLPGRFGGAIISEHPVLPSSEGSKAQGPLNLLNMFTLHFTLENEHGTQKMDVWKVIFSFFQSGDF